MASLPSPRVIANRKNGQRGGLATARKHGKEFCQKRAEKAGQANLAKYGSGFYAHIDSLRKSHKGGRRPKPVPVITVIEL